MAPPSRDSESPDHKVSGGTRSAEGSRVRMALASLFATRTAQARDPLLACRQLLVARTL